MATAATWLENREKLRVSRKRRNGPCLSSAPAPAGIRVDMAKASFLLLHARAVVRSAAIIVGYAVADPGRLVNARCGKAARHCACKSAAVIIAQGGLGIML